MPNKKEFERAEMVGWYDPTQLIDTGKRTVISTIIGENADPRTVASLATQRKSFDYTNEFQEEDDDFKPIDKREREELWIDYVSDVGDGFNPTYAVAYSLAKENLEIPEISKPLKRGEILIFGGDGVYPTATTEEYEKRLVTPYRMAFRANNNSTIQNKTDEVDLHKKPHVFALPGNHDWYDSLVSFQKLFSTSLFNERKFADAWQTRQELGYFALKLPHKWWLFGVDLQLSHNIDVRQLEYFKSVIENKMNPEDKVILCVPEPYWVKTIKYQDITDRYEEKEQSIEKLENELASREIKIKLYLAGDLHHYRRFESGEGQRIQKITAGGGGAFLHPTHDYKFNKEEMGATEKTSHFSLKKNYPSYEESRKLDWKNVYQFLFKNKTFGIIPAIIYIILALLIRGSVKSEFEIGDILRATFDRVIEEPLALLVIILLILGLVFFTDSNSKIYRRVAGTIHGLFHLAAVFFLGWLAYLLCVWFNETFFPNYTEYSNFTWFVSVVLVCGVGGYIVGSILMGLYLFISMHFFGRHDNEAFSSLKIEDYKSFLRLHIDKNGELTIYPIKIEKVPREWIPKKDDGKVVFYDPKDEIKPQLIEKIEPIS